MKKASKVLLLISGIISIIMAIVWLVVAIIEFVRAGEVQAIYAATQSGTVVTIPDWYREYANAHLREYTDFKAFTDAYSASFITSGVIFLLMGLFCIPGAIIAFISKNRENKGLFICDIVFGVLGGTALNLVGGILGLVAVSIKKE